MYSPLIPQPLLALHPSHSAVYIKHVTSSVLFLLVPPHLFFLLTLLQVSLHLCNLIGPLQELGLVLSAVALGLRQFLFQRFHPHGHLLEALPGKSVGTGNEQFPQIIMIHLLLSLRIQQLATPLPSVSALLPPDSTSMGNGRGNRVLESYLA